MAVEVEIFRTVVKMGLSVAFSILFFKRAHIRQLHLISLRPVEDRRYIPARFVNWIRRFYDFFYDWSLFYESPFPERRRVMNSLSLCWHIYTHVYISRDYEESEDDEFLAPWQTREWEFRLVESGSTEICVDAILPPCQINWQFYFHRIRHLCRIKWKTNV